MLLEKNGWLEKESVPGLASESFRGTVGVGGGISLRSIEDAAGLTWSVHIMT